MPDWMSVLKTFLRKKLDKMKKGAIVITKELENSVISGSCYCQGNNYPHAFGLEDGCPRKDQRTTDDVFSTSASLFFCPRENEQEKQSSNRNFIIRRLQCTLSVSFFGGISPKVPASHSPIAPRLHLSRSITLP